MMGWLSHGRGRASRVRRPALSLPDELHRDPLLIPLGLHLLIAGSTGSGKTTLINNMLLAFEPHIRRGDARLLAIDLKDGVSATAAKGFYADIAEDLDGTVRMLDGLRETIRQRNQRLKRDRRLETTWSTDEPLIVVMIDEALQLAADRQAGRALDRILLLGRNTGIMVVAAIQDPRKQAFDMRDHFPERIALHLNSKDETIMAIGQEAVTQGAAPWLIPLGRPGRGWQYDSDAHTARQFQVPAIPPDTLRAASDRLEHDPRIPRMDETAPS